MRVCLFKWYEIKNKDQHYNDCAFWEIYNDVLIMIFVYFFNDWAWVNYIQKTVILLQCVWFLNNTNVVKMYVSSY